MTELLAAIQTYVADNSSGPLTSAITGGFHLLAAADATAMPYCVITPIAAPATHKYGSTPVAFTSADVQFTVWGVAAGTTLGLLDTATTGLLAKFDSKILTLATGQNVNTVRLHDPIPISDMPQDDATGADAYGWMVTYRFTTTR